MKAQTPAQAFDEAKANIISWSDHGTTALNGSELFTYQTKDVTKETGPFLFHWKGTVQRADTGEQLLKIANAAWKKHFDAGLGQRALGGVDSVVTNEQNEVLGQFQVEGWYIEMTYLGNLYKKQMATGRFTITTK